MDGFTSFEIRHESEINETDVKDDWGVIYRRNPHGLPVPIDHPLKDNDLNNLHIPEPNRAHSDVA